MIDHEHLLELTESYLKALISGVSDSVDADFDSFAPFTELGIDSFYVLKLVKQLEQDFGTLPKTLLFEYFNINDLSLYFADKHQSVLTAKFADQLTEVNGDAEPLQSLQPPAVAATPEPVGESRPAPVVAAALIPATPVAAEPAPASEPATTGPILILEKDAYEHPQLAGLLADLFARYKNEGSVSRGTRNIAPNLFIGSAQQGFFNYGRCGGVMVAYAYTGPKEYFPALAQEFFNYCESKDLELNILGVDDVATMGDIACYSTPFGVIQRVLDLDNFTLKGSSMRRLRYQVSKFEKVGSCRTVEYQCGTDKSVDQNIAEVIELWCGARTMVNPLIHIVKAEILAGTLSSEHRLFLTYLDDVLQNVILISAMSSTLGEHNGFLMDLEFYGKAMPLGGLEYAIVNIIDSLKAQGCKMFSMGGTYGCKLASNDNADPALDKILDQLREQNIFNDEGNMQFKNKFRPENQTIYLCRAVGRSNPDNIIDIIMMIADPDKMQTSDAENHTFAASAGTAPAPALATALAPAASVATATAPAASTLNANDATALIASDKGAKLLADNDYNPLNVAQNQVEFDAKTDSWAQLKLPAIDKQMKHLHGQLQQPVNLDDSLRAILPFSHFVVTNSGRSAENLFYQAWANKGQVLSNLMFPTAIFHQIDKGFSPKEIPQPEIFQLSSDTLFKGGLDCAALQQAVDSQADKIAFACIEISQNAAGGAPVSMANIQQVKAILAKASIPLVMDGTRVVENAQLIIDHEAPFAGKEAGKETGKDVWAVVNEIFSYADAVTCSLAKDFCFNKGGVIATNDPQLFNTLQTLNQKEGTGLDVIDKKLLALALNNRKHVHTQVSRRMNAVKSIAETLAAHDIPLVRPVGGHCILFDVKQVAEFNGFAAPVASFAAWMFQNTGIRVGEHSVGMQKNSPINDLVRLAVPVGLTQPQADEMAAKIIALFANKQNIPEIVLAGNAAEAVGDIHAKYRLVAYHHVAAELRKPEQAVSPAPVAKPVPVQAAKPAPAKPTQKEAAPIVKETSKMKEVVEPAPAPTTSVEPAPCKDIAVVGMAGRYPQADNLDKLWNNLKDGVDSVTDIPADRLAKRHQQVFNRNYRGGFIDNVDKFDSLFFNISPREAEVLDPQERLMLETAWEALEDGGYYPENVVADGKPRDIAVYVGAVWAMYQMVGVEEKLAGTDSNPNSFLWSIANRISFWMNFSGPSLTLDTACSSSLTAIYLACEAIEKGECSGAIVGGVNLDLHQHKFDINNAGGALSPDGYCRTFGNEANGYVASEGVGAIYLKSLSQAIADNDNIHGVIKSAQVNHGGRTSGYTVPNPKSQTALIEAALSKANIDARTIGYVEAHGTGTELGDPIEITGLTNAFENYKVPNQSVSIGSVKSNIGHLEAAAGVVGICKVLLQMRHGEIVPSLHSKNLNEHIDFANSPFVVEQQLTPWTGKEVDGVQYPLRAGVSSFGAGGSNAHIILEQYQAVDTAQSVDNQAEQTFPLSARNETQLREMAIRLSDFLKNSDSVNLNDVAYTLQVGKKSFDHRVAIMAKTEKQLIERLASFVDNQSDSKVLTGHIQNAQGITKMLSKKEKQAFIELLSQRRDPNKLAQLWIDGLLTDLQGFQGENSGRRISLPTYPFADKRHWIADGSTSTGSNAGNLSQSAMHPLIDTNESTFQQQLFKKTFDMADFCIEDHVVSDIPTLPGVAYLELARKAGESAAGRKVQRIKNILWVSPLTVIDGKATETLIDLKPSGDVVAFEVFRQDDGNKHLFSQGKLSYATDAELAAQPEYLDIISIRERCEKVIDGAAAYPEFQKFGLNYGPSFQVIQEVYKNDSEVLGLLEIPALRNGDFQQFMLHPSLVDGSMQAGMAAQMGQLSGDMMVPYSIGEVEILHPLQPKCYTYITKSPGAVKPGSKISKENIWIVDEHGKVLVKITESIGVPLVNVHEKPDAAKTAKPADEEAFPPLYYSHVWDRAPLAAANSELDNVLLFDTDEQVRDAYQTRLTAAGKDASQVVLVKPGASYANLGDQTFQLDPLNQDHYSQLFAALKAQSWDISKISYGLPVTLDAANQHQGANLKDGLDQGVNGLLVLSRALIGLKLAGKVQILYVYPGEKGQIQPHNDAVNGYAKSLQMEQVKFNCKTVEIQQQGVDANRKLEAILAEFRADTLENVAVRYDLNSQQNVRYARILKKFDLTPSKSSNSKAATHPQGMGLKERGVYIITGGAGGLGLIFAEFLAKQCKARLVLTGRSALSAEREADLEALRALGSQVLYLPTDVTDFDAVKQLIDSTKEQFGQINGIIHSAGVLRDSYIRNKTADEMTAVLAPKVYGTHHLDELTQNENMDFFVMFSSLAGMGGNAGQCDYAYANHYMDSFAAQREQRKAKGERFGRTLSLNWSLWADGGMKLDEQTEQFFKKSLGIKALSSQTGLDAFVNGLSIDKPHFAVLEAVQEKIELAWGLRKKPAPAPVVAAATVVPATAVTTTTATATAPAAAPAAAATIDLVAEVQGVLAEVVMDFLKLDASDVDYDAILLDLGFDSIGLTSFANVVNEKYGLDLTPVLFFEYPNISEIGKHIAGEFHAKAMAVHQPNAVAPVASASTPVVEAAPAAEAISFNKGWAPAAQDGNASNGSPSTGSFSSERRFVERPIAIVGMSGVMPQSDNLDEFWENLRNGKNMVTDIPRDRWIWEDYDGDPVKETNKSNSRWGGFMKEVDKFDPLFFGITPREAEMMDPQQRLFLQSVYLAIEDSGQKVSDLSGTRTGVFVGVTASDYIDLISENELGLDGYSASGNSHSILANRVSFLLNLRGPSAPMDTACSSSLVALHRGIESIHTGSSDMALVGGVQVMLTPIAHVSLSSAGMLSIDGKCKTFDESANGYVRGEGSGAVFIKPLAMALADGNNIHAVIKATAENHGGKVTMLTAPNPAAQSDLLVEAYTKAEIDPTTVGYIECHGTGTSLGDPIEIQALKSAFSRLYQQHGKGTAVTPYLGLSAVKTNVGHLEPAAGMAGLLKVLLSIKNKQIPQLLHFENLNPYIDLKDSPFYIVDKTTDWHPSQDSNGNDLPRRAGVSAFGWGGANAHVVVEEYIPTERVTLSQDEGPHLIVLSAKSESRLKAYAQLMVDYVQTRPVNLADFAYTLQVGRDVMVDRVGFMADSVDQLIEKFNAFINDASTGNSGDFVSGNINRFKNDDSIKGLVDSSGANSANVAGWIGDNDTAKLLSAWVKGVNIDWSQFYGTTKPTRLSLPTYPFARQRYWLDIPEVAAGEGKGEAGQTAVIHPLVHANTSVLGQQRYSSTFTGKEFFMAEHLIHPSGRKEEGAHAQKSLPAVSYLEMARVAAAQALFADGIVPEGSMVELRDTTWGGLSSLIKPDQQVNIDLFKSNKAFSGTSQAADYEVYSMALDDQGQSQVLMQSQGSVVFVDLIKPIALDIGQLKIAMNHGELAAKTLYSTLATMGKDYGVGYQGVEAIYLGNEQQLVKLSLPEVVTNSASDYVLHPSVMDSVLQAATALVTGLVTGFEADFEQLPEQLPLPQTVKSLKIIAPCEKDMYGWVRFSRGTTIADETLLLDIDLVDSNGKICIKMQSVAFANSRYIAPQADVQAAPEAVVEDTTNQDFESLLATIYQADNEPNLTEPDPDNDAENVNNAFEKILTDLF